jgi:hypothetical protein
MTLRTGHGNGAGVPRIEVMPADELPRGVPSAAPHLSRPTHDERGKFAKGNEIARLGGLARRGKTRLAERMGLSKLPDGSAFRRAQCAELAKTVGGGICGPGPSSMIASAALQLAWSRYLGDAAAETGDAEMALRASKLADASRQNLLAAHELCAREAQARPKRDADPLAAFLPPKEPTR